MQDTTITTSGLDILEQHFKNVLALSDDRLSELRSIIHLRTLKRKEFLIREGAVCNFIGFVLEGTLRSYIMADDAEFNNDFYFDRSFVSAYTSFLTRRPTNCSIEALTNSTIMYITHEDYQSLLARDNEWYKLGSFIAESFFIRKCRRETMFLKDEAAARLENVLAMFPGIEQRVSQYHLASYLGIKPESLSRLKMLTHNRRS